MSGDEIIPARNPVYTRVRVERSIKFVSRKLMDEYTALGGDTFESAGIDPDTPIGRAHTQVIRGWAHGRDGIMGYLAQFFFLESEVQMVHQVRIYVDGELVHQEDLANPP